MSTKVVVVVLFLAAQVIAGWLKKRTQKKQAEALRNGTGTSDGAAVDSGATRSGASRTTVSSTGVSSARKDGTTSQESDSDWEAVRDDDEVSFDVDGEEGRHPRQWQPDQSRDARGKPERASPNALASQPNPAGRAGSGNKAAGNYPSRSGNPSGAAPSARDLLSQLARDMGFKIPDPRPQAKPQAAKPSRTSPPPESQRSSAVTDPSDGFLSNTQATFAAASADGQAQKNPIISSPSVASRLAAEFADPEALRKAFILKTILDKPLSMQPRVPGF